MKSNHPAIRALLRSNADGMTVAQISAALGIKIDSVDQALNNMPDAYKDRWNGPIRGQYEAVWCVVVPPPHCPKPERKANYA